MGLFPYTAGGLNVITNCIFNPDKQDITIMLLHSYWNKTNSLGGQLCVDSLPRFGSHVELEYFKGKMLHWS